MMLGKNALVVDDSLTARTVLKHRLNQFDVILESAADGSLALELLRDHTPDVIFLDHHYRPQQPGTAAGAAATGYAGATRVRAT